MEYICKAVQISIREESNEVGRDLRVKIIWELLINRIKADPELSNYEVYSNLIKERT
jgi:hypothetical protein